MDIEKTIHKMYEIRPAPGLKAKGGVFGKGRYLLGRTESCDLIVNHESISAVHSVLEIFEDRAVIYDMNSTNGTYVNDDRIIVKEIRLGDTFRLADAAFEFRLYVVGAALPPVLDSLEPEQGLASVKVLPSLPTEAVPKKLPSTAPSSSTDVPSIVYPLAADPRAEFSEYIFEDRDEIYPIFKYEPSKQAVEVIILFKDQVYSVDYLPEGPYNYKITGLQTQNEEVEFPYFGKTEKIPFVDVQGGQTVVQALPGFSVFHLSDKKKDTGHQGANIKLSGQDIVRLHNGDLQIFVRNVSAPPKVAHAPILKRDPDFRKYLFLFLLVSFLVTLGINVIELEDPKKDEDAPERLATILYRQPLVVSKNEAVAKTEKAPDRVQKAPQKPAVDQKVPKEVQPVTKTPDVIETKDQSKKPDPGKPKETTKQVVKQGTQPVTTPTDKIAAPVPTKNNNNDSAAQPSPSKNPTAFSKVESKAIGHVEVYRSADFKSSISSLVAKGGSLSGIQTKSATGAGGDITGVTTGVSTGSGSVKTADIATNQGSLVGATTGVLGTSKGAEGLSAKKAIYTAGIPSETVVLGSMDPDVIRRILLDHLPQFRYCYQKELERTGAEMSGVIKLDFNIGASGHVSQAGVDSSSGLPTDVKKCVIGVLKGIAFPEPMGGGTVEVKQPMNFYPKRI